MFYRQFVADRQQAVFGYSELAQFLFRLDISFCKMSFERLGYVFGLDSTGSELYGVVSVLLLSFNGNKVKTALDLRTALSKCKVGDRAEVTIMRNGQRESRTVVLEEVPKDYGN